MKTIMAESDKKPGFVANIIAAVGFFFLLLIILWALINITRWAPALFDRVGSLFGGTQSVSETLVLTAAPAETETGETVSVSWDHNATRGSYAFTYACTSGTSIQVPTAANTFTVLPCESAYVVSANGAHSIEIKPITSAETITIPVFVTYRDEANAAGASDSRTLTVTNSTTNSGNTGNGSGNNDSNSGSNGSGNNGSTGGTPVSAPDLVTTLIGFGVMQGETFVQTNEIKDGQTAAVRFRVTNAGNAAVGAWRFSASLPANPVYNYQSTTQQSLAPGAYIDYTLRFTNIAPQGGLIDVIADSDYSVAESNEINNRMTYDVDVYRAQY